MNNFVFYNPTKIIFGKNTLDSLSKEISQYGKKVLLTYGGGSIKKTGIYDKVIEALKDCEVAEFSGIEPNPRVETLAKGVAVAKKFQPDFILAVGGGSVIDGSKYIAAATHYDGDGWEMFTNNKEPSKYIPFGVVLTLAATGSEMNKYLVVTKWETHEKPAFERYQLFPKFSILDPLNTVSVPNDQTAYGIVDAFSHVLEQYINVTQDTPLQDRFSESILVTLIENSDAVMKNPSDYTARANIMLSATMALNDVAAVGVGQDWATHAVGHEFSAFYDMPHGASLAIVTPHWMKAVKSQKAAKLAQYGRRVWGLDGADSEVVGKAIDKTHEFFKSLGVKMSLKEWGIGTERFEEIVTRLVKAKIGEITLNEEQIRTILQGCVEGKL